MFEQSFRITAKTRLKTLAGATTQRPTAPQQWWQSCAQRAPFSDAKDRYGMSVGVRLPKYIASGLMMIKGA
jgi:hypothetical protein